MKLRIHLKDGIVIDLEAPDNFDFNLGVQSVRSVGFFCNGALFVPAENISFMVAMTDGAAPVNVQKYAGTLQ